MDKIDQASDGIHRDNRNGYGYEKLGSSTTNDERAVGITLQSKSVECSRCLPVFGILSKKPTKRLTPEVVTTKTTSSTTTTTSSTKTTMKSKSVRKVDGQVNDNKKLAKTHPLYNMSDLRRSRKAFAKPEFLRYMEYVKEGGSSLDT